MLSEFIAHVRGTDKEKKQSLKEHLEGVADLSQGFAAKGGLEKAGEIIGLLHDLGKYSGEFQNYLKSATGILNPDEDEDYVDAKGLKGKVDHSTAGAQLVWKELLKQGQLGQIVGQVLALCIASHHSGLIDCLTVDSSNPVTDGFSKRMEKREVKAHLEEALKKANPEILKRFYSIITDKNFVLSVKKFLYRIHQNAPDKDFKDPSQSIVVQFQTGLLVRFLFSCLIDGDRINSADFERPRAAKYRLNGYYKGWEDLVCRLESYLAQFKIEHAIDTIRNEISQYCLDSASKAKGIYTLTVPTGGGKTLASLRFALHHAKIHGLDRVIYIIPFTSIIDQNAEVARKILEPEAYPNDKGKIVLEHHSNLTSENQSWREKMLTDNWDAPIIYTTSVQFLESLFGSGTRSARRMHQLANAILVFDEIQTLPIRCVHMFNNAINFLVEQCGSTVILCTATQPLLADVDPMKGAIRTIEGTEIMPNVQVLFENLKRVNVIDRRKAGGWAEDDIADLAINESAISGSCLVVVNTKKAARNIFRKIESRISIPLFHLSTSMCPVHRKKILVKVRDLLKNKKPALCISTQLIEAGVDVDFGSVIRFAAGLDSIAQAAGRCNRNGNSVCGSVYVLNPTDENLSKLDDIRIGLEKAERVMDEFKEDPAKYDFNLIGPKAMQWYYKNYFFDRKNEMDYPLDGSSIERNDTILNLLSINSLAVSDFKRAKNKAPDIYLRQSFMTANKAFQAINAPTKGVIVQYGIEGEDLVTQLCAAFEVDKQFDLLQRAQQYTVNVFPHEFQKLLDDGALEQIQEDIQIYYLNKRYYSNDFGLTVEPVSEKELLYV